MEPNTMQPTITTQIFTFGFSSEYGKKYVKINALDFNDARAKMIELHGTAWAFQYTYDANNEGIPGGYTDEDLQRYCPEGCLIECDTDALLEQAEPDPHELLHQFPTAGPDPEFPEDEDQCQTCGDTGYVPTLQEPAGVACHCNPASQL